ncbi:MAG: hypothetical protein H7Z73_02325 [Candidatus Saccharibacteria bacterium]|nr:hypothetical protein [Moraxellaceae bacterium]
MKEKLSGEISRFDELWQLVPDFSSKLREFNADGNWLHWTPKTFDGWYCIKTSIGYEVYYQERGVKSDFTHFKDEKGAIKFAIDVSVCSLQ